jgi:hypothetical protein
MIDRSKYERGHRIVRPAAPEPPPPEPLRNYKPKRAIRMPTKEEVNAAVQRAIRRSTEQSKALERASPK